MVKNVVFSGILRQPLVKPWQILSSVVSIGGSQDKELSFQVKLSALDFSDKNNTGLGRYKQ